MTEQKKENTSISARIAMTPEAEVELLKATFKGNEFLLKGIRLFLYGLPVDDDMKKLIASTFSNSDLKRAFRKKIYPILEEDLPDIAMNSLADFWYGAEGNIIGQSEITISQNLQSKAMVKRLLENAMSTLSHPEKGSTSLVYDPTYDQFGTQLLARNLYIRTINEGINVIMLIVNQETETKEQKEVRTLKNSNK